SPLTRSRRTAVPPNRPGSSPPAARSWFRRGGEPVVDGTTPSSLPGGGRCPDNLEGSRRMATTTAMERSWRDVLSVHVSVTKPRIIVLIALTTWAGMGIAAPGQSPAALVFFILLGTALSVASAHTF